MYVVGCSMEFKWYLPGVCKQVANPMAIGGEGLLYLMLEIDSEGRTA